MPKMIGRPPPDGATLLDNNNTRSLPGYVRVSWRQMDYALRTLSLPAREVRASLDTSDQGGPGSLAKRWYRWFIPAEVARKGTPAMQRRAGAVLPVTSG